MTSQLDPDRECALCPRLVAYRAENRVQHPDWFNGAVPNFGTTTARLLIIGLAPGVSGANRTGRPFTGDYAGDLLYASLAKFGFSDGQYDRRADDGLTLQDCRITNAVRCVPPQNKPTPAEITMCRPFLADQLTAITAPTALLCLGKISHDSTIRALGGKLSQYPFAHGARHHIDHITVFDSYHCSRYNTNTGRLTEAMFEEVFADFRAFIDDQSAGH